MTLCLRFFIAARCVAVDEGSCPTDPDGAWLVLLVVGTARRDWDQDYVQPMAMMECPLMREPEN